MTAQAFTGADVFDGNGIAPAMVIVEGGHVVAVRPPGGSVAGMREVALGGGVLAPGFVDLQVNGGGGLMLNDDPSVATLETMAQVHAGLGATTILPTLITDVSEVVRATVDAVVAAVAKGVSGIAGLHLEGPHLSVARKGAHDPALIRAMGADDLKFLLDAACRVPRLMVTLAPESVSTDQIAALTAAGVIVSLGHTDAGFDICRAAFAAGAQVATHLFNAMSPLGNREPGLVGAVLSTAAVSAGLIADGMHVHPAVIATAMAAKTGPGEIFLVSDAMAPAGTAMMEFTLNGRRIMRGDGLLTLPDGTLAGADLDLARAVRMMMDAAGVGRSRALSMVTRVPARVLRMQRRIGALVADRHADMVHLSDEGILLAVWRAGRAVSLSQT
jgi:N-acetylglucosamine-6-phosphate deacetylase